MERKSILVVDDEADIRLGLTRLLTRAGYRVDTVSDGADAVTRVREAGWYDLIVMDVMMPRMDGYGALQALRDAGFGGIPVVLLTARSSPTEVAHSHDAGAAVFVRKPFSPSGLINAVEYAMQSAVPQRPGAWLD